MWMWERWKGYVDVGGKEIRERVIGRREDLKMVVRVPKWIRSYYTFPLAKLSSPSSRCLTHYCHCKIMREMDEQRQ